MQKKLTFAGLDRATALKVHTSLADQLSFISFIALRSVRPYAEETDICKVR